MVIVTLRTSASPVGAGDEGTCAWIWCNVPMGLVTRSQILYHSAEVCFFFIFNSVGQFSPACRQAQPLDVLDHHNHPIVLENIEIDDMIGWGFTPIRDTAIPGRSRRQHRLGRRSQILLWPRACLLSIGIALSHLDDGNILRGSEAQQV